MNNITQLHNFSHSQFHQFVDKLNHCTHSNLLECLLNKDCQPPPRRAETKRQRKELPTPPHDLAVSAVVRHALHFEQLQEELKTLHSKKLSREQLTKAEIARFEYLQKLLAKGGAK